MYPSGRTSLMQNFVSQQIGHGFHHISHVSQHTTPLAETLFSQHNDEAAIIVLNGTYTYIQKSADYAFQRMSFSMHKHRPLLKPMDGYIIFSIYYIILYIILYYILYYARNNDASITKHMMKTNTEGMMTWLNDDDIFIVDRGFREVTQYLQEEGFGVEMPRYLKTYHRGSQYQQTPY